MRRKHQNALRVKLRNTKLILHICKNNCKHRQLCPDSL